MWRRRDRLNDVAGQAAQVGQAIGVERDADRLGVDDG